MKKELLTGTALYNAILDKYEHLFEKNCSPSFSNLIWQLVVNEGWSDKKTHCFSAVVSPQGYMIGIVEDGETGYYPTNVCFVKGMGYDLACENIDELNKDLFGLMERACMELQIRSMRT